MKKRSKSFLGISVICWGLAAVVLVTAAHGAGQPPTRLPTEPGTPALVPAGPDAGELAKAAWKKAPSAQDAVNNPTNAAPGVNRVAEVFMSVHNQVAINQTKWPW